MILGFGEGNPPRGTHGPTSYSCGCQELNDTGTLETV